MKIHIENLSKRFGATTVITGVSLDIEHGEMLTLLGASGSGKTTLLRMIAGLERPDSGRILFGDQVVNDPANRIFVPARARNLGMVFQSYALWPHLDVAGNLSLALSERGSDSAGIRARVDSALQLVGLDGLGTRAIHQLSGGQQQRVALARALVAQPALLLFDEPLSNLDAGLREQMRTEISSLQKRLGITAVFVTHDQTEALALSDRIVILDRGSVAQIDTPDDLYRAPRSGMTARFLGKANLLPAQARDGGVRVGTVTLQIAQPVSSGGAAAGLERASMTLMIRPEAVEFATAGALAGTLAPNTVRGDVRHVELQGALRLYDLWVEALAQHLLVYCPSQQAVREGLVDLYLPPAQLRPIGAAHVFDAEADREADTKADAASR